MAERFKMPVAVFIILEKDGKIWLQRRASTGYRDGFYDLPAGHVDGGETVRQAAARETKEETGVVVKDENLIVKHLQHNNDNTEYIHVYFKASEWENEPSNVEPLKCDDAGWFPLDALPEPLIPHIALALRCMKENIFYSEPNWAT